LEQGCLLLSCYGISLPLHPYVRFKIVFKVNVLVKVEDTLRVLVRVKVVVDDNVLVKVNVLVKNGNGHGA
jgi:hypothetical protein